MVNQLITFIIGIIILLLSTETFVNFAKRISLILKLSPLVIGITVVAIGTSLPEFAVSVLASIKGDRGLAIGNIIGSNITNVFLVLPVGILMGKLRIGTTKTQRSAFLMLLATILFLLLSFSSYPGMFIGLILLLAAVFVSYAEYTWGVEGRKKEDIRRFHNSAKFQLRPESVLVIPLSVIGIIAGATMTVLSVEEISKLLGLSTTILGLTLSAVATSLPELFATVVSQNGNSEKLMIGNILGSQIYNLLLVGGTVFFFSRTIVLSWGDWVFFFLQAIIFAGLIFSYKDKVIPKMTGIVLLSIYLLYLITIKISNP